MGKNKLKRWNDLNTLNNVYQQAGDLKGNWKRDVFKNDRPIVVELGCGKAEYTVGMSAMFPEKNFIGIDVKGHRLWNGAKICANEQRPNAAFVRCQIDHINAYFDANEVEEIWLTFPDPQPQSPRERKRLTSPMFLERYKQFLIPNGIINLKTDSDVMYHYTKEIIQEFKLPVIHDTDQLYTSELYTPLLQIKTTYEKLFTGRGSTIKYIKFRLV
jgi:tRNA (guanine-N7-)-methyltransferase